MGAFPQCYKGLLSFLCVCMHACLRACVCVHACECVCLIVCGLRRPRRASFCLEVTDQIERWQLPFAAIDFTVTLKAPNSTIILFNCHTQRLIIVESGLQESSTDRQLELALCFPRCHTAVGDACPPMRRGPAASSEGTSPPNVVRDTQKRGMWFREKSCHLV